MLRWGWPAAAGILLILACSDSTSPRRPNVAPDVWVVKGPVEGDTIDYFPELFWDGFDPDGVVWFFEYRISNNGPGGDPGTWTRTDRYDDTFVVNADRVIDAGSFDSSVLVPENVARSHTFSVRAIDNELLRSTEPATRSFVSRNISPVVDISNPGGGAADTLAVGPTTFFQWAGVDYIDDLSNDVAPRFSRHALIGITSHGGTYDSALDYLRNTPDAPEWSAWVAYDAPDLSGRQWQTPALSDGRYVFAVQVRDEANATSMAIDTARNARRLFVSTATP